MKQFDVELKKLLMLSG